MIYSYIQLAMLAIIASQSQQISIATIVDRDISGSDSSVVVVVVDIVAIYKQGFYYIICPIII